jgi:ribosome biogenesis GTPase
MVKGTVLRRHAGGYLVYCSDLGKTLTCPLRARLKKEGVSLVTGDEVELDEVETSVGGERGTAVISGRLERRNLLTRPFLANINQVFIVQSIHQPEFSGLLMDRYLVHLQLELPAVRHFVCINKCDLALPEAITALRNIYEPLGYSVLFVSAKTGEGIEGLKRLMCGKTSVFTGPSGVGKSSLINQLNPTLKLKVDVNEDLEIGRHTTTYSELYPLLAGDQQSAPDVKPGPAAGGVPAGMDPDGAEVCAMGWIADTPGFSLGELKHPEPLEVAWQFPEMAALAEECKYSNCLHLVEEGCNILSNLDAVNADRYQSYQTIMAESQQEAKLQRETSQKIESGVVKYVGGGKYGRGKAVPKLNSRYRTASRRSEKQQVSDLAEEDHDADEE